VKRLATALTVVVVAALACDQPVEPPGTGSIRIAFAPASQPVAPAPGALPEANTPRHPDELPDSARQTVSELAPSGEPVGPGYQVMALTGAIISIAGPSTNILDTITVGASGASQQYDNLPVGTYVVKVWGLVGTEVDAYGEASGVSVSENQATTVDLANPGPNGKPWASVRPTLRPITPNTTTSFVHSVHWGAVATATGYTVEWSPSADFSSGVLAKSLADTITTVAVADTGRY